MIGLLGEVYVNVFKNKPYIGDKKMETIKFQAWDKIDKRMCIVEEIQFNPSFVWVRWYLLEVCQGYYVRSLSNLILRQFTGLYDKNGKEIYEGDILTGRQNPIVVEYKAPAFVFVYKNVKEGNWITHLVCGWADICEPEIIGNIYENSELLGDK